MGHVNPTFANSLEKLQTPSVKERTKVSDLNLAVTPDSARLPNPINREAPKKMGCFKPRCHWFVNGLIIFSISGLIFILELDVIPFRSLGFQCRDPNLSYKFRGDTIPFGYLMAISVSVPLIAIILVELIMLNSTRNYLTTKKLKSLKQAWSWYSQYFLGFLILILAIQMGKSLILEPRPHFFETCRPNKAINCTSEYISDYKCTNKNLTRRAVRDSFRSFPSGHAALGVYLAVFMVWFFQVRIPRNNYLVVPWLQCLFLAWGLLCALTRITDRRHHWWDVLAGSLLGSAMAIFTVKVFCENFRYKHKPRKPDKNLNDTGNNINSTWSKQLLSSMSSGHSSDDRELREVK